MELYAALGERIVIQNEEVAVLCGGQEKILSPQEFVLWECLVWHILSFEALHEAYCNTIARLQICPEMDFCGCLRRMIQRRLVRAGRGDVESEALYDLLAPLAIVPLHDTLLIKWRAFFKMLCCGYTLKTAQRTFSRTQLDKVDRDIISLVKRQRMNTAEIIRCVERGVGRHSSKKEIERALYADSIAESAQVLSAGRFSPARRLVLDTIKSLCLKNKIVFAEQT